MRRLDIPPRDCLIYLLMMKPPHPHRARSARLAPPSLCLTLWMALHLAGCSSTPPSAADAAARAVLAGAAPVLTGSSPSGADEWMGVGDEAVALLREYLKIDTSNAPGVPGASGDVRLAADFFERVLKQEGIEVQRIAHPEDPTRVFVIGRLRGDGSAGKALILEHHMDVVPAEGTWTRPPFAADVHEGWLYGRGAADDKGLGILHLMALVQLKRQRAALGRDLLFIATPDEEIGGERGVAWLTAKHWNILDPAVVLEEGGFGYEGRYRPGLAFEVQVDQKRILWVELEAKAEGGHGSVPRENALVVLQRAVDRILELPREPRITPTVDATYTALSRDPIAARRIVDAVVTDPAERARLVDSISLTRMQGSDKVNTQPRVAKASLDIRLLPDTDPADFLARLTRAIGDNRVAIHELHPREGVGTASPVDSPFFRAIAQAVEQNFPGAIAIPTLSTGGTDSRNYRIRGVPAYGFIPFVVPQGDRLRIHDIDERVRVEDIRRGVKVMYEVVLAIARRK